MAEADKKPKPLTDEQLVSLVDQEFSSALGAPGGDISEERAAAWAYYNGELFGDEEEGSSSVVTSDVADVVDGIMPSLLRLFTTADNLVSFDAVGPNDEPAAAQESDYVSYVFFKRNPAFMILFFWFFDALLQKNGITMAYWCESEARTQESYEGLSEEELVELAGDENLEPIEKSEPYEVETVDEQTGAIVKAMVVDAKFWRIEKTGYAAVDNVPPEEYRISKDARSLDPAKARMVGRDRTVTRSELLEMGFDKEIVDALPAEAPESGSPEKQARQDKSDDQESPQKTIDRSQDPIRLKLAYQKVDADGDGYAELREIYTAGGKLLGNEVADRQPFHIICPHPLSHKHFGDASADKVMDLQLQSSTFLRQIYNNLYHVNNPGHAVWEQAIGENTMDDLLTTRVGSVKRFARPLSEGAYQALTVPFTARDSFPVIEYLGKVKRDRTGVSSDSEGLSPEALKNIQQSVLNSATDISKMKIEAIGRIFAETGLKSLFMHLHELVLKHQKKAEVVKLRGEWTPVNPAEWRTRRDMTVNIGLGIGTREQNLVHLEAIWNKQTAMAAGGGMNLTVTPRNMYNTAAEFVKNANLKTPQMFFTDPGDKQAPPPPDQLQQLQQQQQQIEQRQQEIDQRKQKLDEQALALDRQQMMLDHQNEIAELRRKHEADRDKYALGQEDVRTRLTELELKYGVNVPGSKV